MFLDNNFTSNHLSTPRRTLPLEMIMQNKISKLKNIIFACKQGNELAQQQLYKDLYSYGMSICIRYADRREEAYEMLNDGFYKVFTKIDKYDLEFPFRPWFKVVMVNAAIDYQRRKKNFYTDKLEEVQTALVDDFDIEERLVYEDLLDIVQQLPPAYRTVFNLYVMEGYKHHEIAEKLNISVGASKSNLHKAKQKLKALMAKIYQAKSN